MPNRKRILDLVDLLHRLMMGGEITQDHLNELADLSRFDINEISQHDELTAMTVDCLSYMIQNLLDDWPNDNYNDAALRSMYRIALGINEEIISINVRTY